MPKDLIGVFDIVHIRAFGMNVKTNSQLSRLIENLMDVLSGLRPFLNSLELIKQWCAIINTDPIC